VKLASKLAQGMAWIWKMQQPPGERGAAGEPTPVALRKQGTHNTGRGMYVKIKSLGGVLSGKLSALSKPNLARKYSLESS